MKGRILNESEYRRLERLLHMPAESGVVMRVSDISREIKYLSGERAYLVALTPNGIMVYTPKRDVTTNKIVRDILHEWYGVPVRYIHVETDAQVNAPDYRG